MSADKISDKELSKLAREARRRGWNVRVTSGNHLRWTHPSGRTFTSSQTPGNGGTCKRIASMVRRVEAGQPIPHDRPGKEEGVEHE